MNLEQARTNMIKQQIRTWGVADNRVVEVLQTVAREDFVPMRHRKLAFSDLRLPLGHDQVMMRPLEQGRLLQGLELKPSDRVLEVGTGSGFLTACLAALTEHVTSIERIAELADRAAANLDSHGRANLTLLTGDVFEAGLEAGAYDAIVVTASVPSVPEPFLQALRPGGRLFIVRGRSPAMEALIVHRDQDGKLSENSLFDTDLPRLHGTEEPEQFHFD
ncbi:MAG: protein-L-isoaspartate O-methyltransferase [Wenzhouxiangellaceae bacterium]|nr:protein-L-isoaspartate O-methyltransferase [Wenzhouxiangellaceae bacterium]